MKLLKFSVVLKWNCICISNQATRLLMNKNKYKTYLYLIGSFVRFLSLQLIVCFKTNFLILLRILKNYFYENQKRWIGKAKRHICLVCLGRYSLLNNGSCQVTSLIYINISVHYILQRRFNNTFFWVSSHTKNIL